MATTVAPPGPCTPPVPWAAGASRSVDATSAPADSSTTPAGARTATSSLGHPIEPTPGIATRARPASASRTAASSSRSTRRIACSSSSPTGRQIAAGPIRRLECLPRRERVDQHQAGAALDRLELEAQARLLRLVVDDPRWVKLHDRVLLRRLVRTAPGEGVSAAEPRLDGAH